MRKNSGPVEYWLCGDQVWSLDCKKNEMNTSDRKRTGWPLFPSTVNLIFKSASVLRYGYIVLSFYDFLISDAREEKFEVQSQLFGGSVGGA
jgi:hypothetical protein